MKSLLLILALFVIFVIRINYSQSSEWKLQCIRRPLTSINFVSQNHSWIYGGDIAYESTDNGASWNNPILLNHPVCKLFDDLFPRSNSMLFFINNFVGWGCQYSNVLIETGDGGQNWYEVKTGITGIYLESIFFTNQFTGWAAGWNSVNNGVIIKTTNAGINWFLQQNNINHEVTSIWMINSQKGFFTVSQRDTIGVTTNGGDDWTFQKEGNGQPINKIFFVDSANGWLIGNYLFNTITTNSGNNWTFRSDNVSNPLNAFFVSPLTGWLAGTANRIWRTSDSGISWTQCTFNPTGDYEYYNYVIDIKFKNENTGWAIQGDGTVLKSTNSGVNWSNEIYSPLGDITSIYFSDENTGCAISNYKYGVEFSSNNGYIWKTTDRGSNWDQQLITQNNEYIESLCFINPSTGFACGNNKIFKTINGGNNWITDSIGNNFFNSIFFNDSLSGWVCGRGGAIYKTNDNGNNWVAINSPNTTNLNSIYFINNTTGFAGSDSGKVLKTTNGGDNWSITLPFGNRNIKQIYFIDNLKGFIIANRTILNFQTYYTSRVFLKTTDGGDNWVTIIDTTVLNRGFDFNSIYFSDEQNGLMVSGKSEIMSTTNGGVDWLSDTSSMHEKYLGVYSLNNQTGWISGSNGMIISKGVSPIGIHNEVEMIPKKFQLFQNYPNPFNPNSTIKFALPKDAKVTIKIYDILGREVKTLVNEFKKAGYYQAIFDGTNFASGVYFYRIEARLAGSSTGDFVDAKKMVLIK